MNTIKRYYAITVGGNKIPVRIIATCNNGDLLLNKLGQLANTDLKQYLQPGNHYIDTEEYEEPTLVLDDREDDDSDENNNEHDAGNKHENKPEIAVKPVIPYTYPTEYYMLPKNVWTLLHRNYDHDIAYMHELFIVESNFEYDDITRITDALGQSIDGRFWSSKYYNKA